MPKKILAQQAGLCFLFVAMFAAVAGVVPFHDDWTYLTAPIADFEWRMLLPGDSFWRPFDVLWGALMGAWTNAWPLANRIAICAGHCVNALLLCKIFSRLADKKSGLFAAAFFAVNSAVAATIVNTDTINQVWSLSFGLLALRVTLSHRHLTAYLLILLSVLFKESGVSWLAVIPLANAYQMWKSADGRESRIAVILFLAKRAFVGVGFLVGYLAIRFLLRGDITLGTGNYQLGFNVVEIFKNLSIALIVPLSGVDAFAFVKGNYLVAGLTVILAFAFWCLLAGCDNAWTSKGLSGFVTKILVAGAMSVALALPHCCMVATHPAEIHFYPVLFAGTWLISQVDFAKCSRISIGALVAAFVVLNAIVWTDKMSAVYASSERTDQLLSELRTKSLDYSKPVYVVVNADKSVIPYSVFSQTAAHGVDFGGACRLFNSWHPVDYRVIKASMIIELPVDSQVIRIK